jgi:hypothetical protein
VLCRKLLTPLQSSQRLPALRFLTQWDADRQRLRQQADEWWKQHLAGTAASTTQHSSSSSSSSSKRQQQQQGGVDPGGGLYSTVNSTIKGVMSWASSGWQGGSDKSSSGIGSSTGNGCPLCQQEQQEQLGTAAHAAAAAAAAADSTVDVNSAAAGAASAAASSPCSPAGGVRDPFMWRRLMWGLLGRLKPTARDWYVQD